MCRTGVGAGHVLLDVSKRRTPVFLAIGIDFGHPEDEVTSGEQEAGLSPILVTRSSTGDDCRCAPVQGHSASLVCAGSGTSDCAHG